MNRRRKYFLAVVWIVLGVSFVFVFRRNATFDSYSNIEELPKSLSNSIIGTTPITDRQKNYSTAKSEAPVSRAEPEVDEFEQCESMEGQINTTAVFGGDANKQPMWCMYKDEVALRIIVLTFNRHESLLKLLK